MQTPDRIAYFASHAYGTVRCRTAADRRASAAPHAFEQARLFCHTPMCRLSVHTERIHTPRWNCSLHPSRVRLWVVRDCCGTWVFGESNWDSMGVSCVERVE